MVGFLRFILAKEAEEFRSVAANARQVAQARSRERVMQVRERFFFFFAKEKIGFFKSPGGLFFFF